MSGAIEVIIKSSSVNKASITYGVPQQTFYDQISGRVKSLKSHWHEACHSFVEKNPGKSITKYNFSVLLNMA